MSESDPTEDMRRFMVMAINATAEPTREEAEKRYGQVWDTQELQRDFDVAGFYAPFVLVTRKSDNVRGTLMFQHLPRFYFEFAEAEVQPAEEKADGQG